MMKNKSRVRNYGQVSLVLVLALSAVLIPGLAGASGPTLVSENTITNSRLALLHKAHTEFVTQLDKYAHDKLDDALQSAIENNVSAMIQYLTELEASLEEEWTLLLDFEIECSAVTDEVGYLACEAVFSEATGYVSRELTAVQALLSSVEGLEQVGAIYDDAGTIRDYAQEVQHDAVLFARVLNPDLALNAKVEAVVHYSPTPTTTTTVAPATTTTVDTAG